MTLEDAVRIAADHGESQYAVKPCDDINALLSMLRERGIKASSNGVVVCITSPKMMPIQYPKARYV